MVRSSVVVCSLLVALAAGTDVKQCQNHSYENLSENVQLMPCKKLPCRLKKGTSEHITIKFKPEKDIANLKNHVTAEVFGVALPFVGVDGVAICDKIETESGEKAACPLSAGTTYVYKDSFPVHSFYPTLETKVHWALKTPDNKDIICFEVPVSIK